MWKACPHLILSDAGFEPDPWQAAVLDDTDSARILLLCSRQTGKTLTAAALALREALLRPESLILLLSPSLRQSGELFRAKLLSMYRKLGKPIRATSTTALTIELANGSRVVALPGEPDTIVGFSGVNLLVVDEASRVTDELYKAIRPMLATSKGKLIALSTPYGQRGWFYDAWESKEGWRKHTSRAVDCPRISAEFLEEERRELGPRWFRQEHECQFEAAMDAVFDLDAVKAAVTSKVKPLDLE